MIQVDSAQIFAGVLGFMWLEFLWEAYIGLRQKKIYQTKTTGIQKVSDRFPEQIEPITIKSPEVEMFKSEYTVLGKISTFGFLIEIALL